MMLFQRPPSSRGLTILESLVVLCTSLILIITLVPVALVQMGMYKLPEPEITPKPMLINGKAIVEKDPAAIPAPFPVPSSSPAPVTPLSAAKTPESPKPPVSSQANPPQAPQKPAPSPASASTKP